MPHTVAACPSAMPPYPLPQKLKAQSLMPEPRKKDKSDCTSHFSIDDIWTSCKTTNFGGITVPG